MIDRNLTEYHSEPQASVPVIVTILRPRKGSRPPTLETYENGTLVRSKAL